MCTLEQKKDVARSLQIGVMPFGKAVLSLGTKGVLTTYSWKIE